MKASYNWLKDYLKFDHTPESLGDILTDIGLEVEGMDVVESIKGGLKGVVAGEVLTCVPHPNADRLKLTTVNIGQLEPLQIVCGAPNVDAGQKVWVATVGTEIHIEGKDSFTIKEAKVRGEYSKGMICAEDELGLGEDHDGIMVLDPSINIGTKAADHYEVEIDHVYEIGLTPNRSDAICHLGVADDLLAYLKVNETIVGEVNRPEVETIDSENELATVNVEVENSEACPRYTGVSLTNIVIKESPAWMQRRLSAIGVKCINNIVDITNFVLHEYGQPLHAFDLDKIKEHKIKVKTLPQDSTFLSLDEQERKLSDQDLMICDGASNPMCIGGVYGGLHSGVTDSTTSIFLESAHFDPGWIRRTSTRHLLRTDAAKVFEKGSDPNITLKALQRAVSLMKKYADAKVSSEVVDIYPKMILPAIIPVNYANVNRLIGVPLSTEKINQIAQAMNMEIVEQDETGFSIAVPTNKHDVTREVDVIEEILRIYGYNHIPISAKMHTTMSISEHPTMDEFRKVLGDFLAANGFLEIMGLSLINSKYYEEQLPLSSGHDDLVSVMNTSNINMDVMRPDMMVTALQTVQYNQNRQQSDLRLFELGRSYSKRGDAFSEKDHLTLTMTGQGQAISWENDQRATSFFTLKKHVEKLLQRIGIHKYKVVSSSEDSFLQFGLSYMADQVEIVRFGKIKSAHTKYFDIRTDVWVADFSLEKIYRKSKEGQVVVAPMSKYPSMTRDLAIIIGKSVTYDQVAQVAKKAAPKQLVDTVLFDVYQDDEHLGTENKSLAIRFTFQDQQKTLTDKELDKFTNKILGALKHHLKAALR